MRNTLNKIPNKLLILQVVFTMIWSLLRSLVLWSRPAAQANILLLLIVTVMAILHLRGTKPHPVASSIWSILAIAAANGIGILGVLAFWLLASRRTDRQNHAESTKKANTTSCAGSIKKVYGRIPFIRLPIPWLTYTLDCLSPKPKAWKLVRDDLFRDHRNGRKHGEHDPIFLSDIADSAASSAIYQFLSGTTCWSFMRKKVGKEGDKEFHWHNMPAEMYPLIEEALTEVKAA